jgi:uncharacterized protein
MSIWAISDLHLTFSTPEKSMEAFGENWEKYQDKIEKNWKKHILPEDLVLLAGDTSWAMKLEDALIDLRWIDALPGRKLLIKGNHDYWWSSLNKLKKEIPSSLHVIQNDVYLWNDVAIGGARLWASPDIPFDRSFHEIPSTYEEPFDEKIFFRELQRLNISLSQMPKECKVRIAMTHFPPISPEMKVSPVTPILEKFGIQKVVFGHLHNIKNEEKRKLFGSFHGIDYFLTSCDYLDFTPLKIL